MALIIVTGFILGASLIATNWLRAKNQLNKIQLLPNCLLTRYPLVFIGGKKTPFYFLSYWNQIPMFLREHGYEVIEIDLPWRNIEARRASVFEQLRSLEKKYGQLHLIADPSTEEEFLWINKQQPSFVESYSLVSTKKMPSQKLSAEQLKPGFKEIQHLSIHSHNATLYRSLLSPQWISIAFHNLALYPEKGLSPSTVGHPVLNESIQILHQYLTWANKLAEEDC